MKWGALVISMLFICSCGHQQNSAEKNPSNQIKEGVELIVLGTVQDAGSPHIGCTKPCCEQLFNGQHQPRYVVSLGLIDYASRKKYLFEATPDITHQLKKLKSLAPFDAKEMPDGIFLTHAHIGHYAGLMYLGKEAINAAEVPVYAMPRMDSFLRLNGPWNQLVQNQNIYLKRINPLDTLVMTPQLRVIPILVPHRDEYSETVGYKILGPNKSLLFIPDIDKWQKWELNIVDEVKQVDFAFLDATFYDGEEIKARDISQIPHPFVVESMELFKELSASEKNKIHFIHFNHTNPLLDSTSKACQTVLKNGFRVACYLEAIEL